MHDVLWKEIALWLGKMPQFMRDKYEWTTGYLRITESPETWFARAKTARKENPEALAGVHGESVMFVIDEAAGVVDEIFNVAEGALTGENVLVLMISNPTRLRGYFYDSHHSDKRAWQTYQFSSEDSPIVDREFVQRILNKHGEDSDEYKIRVRGQFPAEDAVDDRGYVPLFLEKDIRETRGEVDFVNARMGVDPSGEGEDETVWVIRDRFRAKVLAKEKISTPKSIAEKTMTLAAQYDIPNLNVFMDTFGEGADSAIELANSGFRVNSVNVGKKPNDENTFLNIRAEAFQRIKQWLKKDGELIASPDWKELLDIRFKRNLQGKIQIMSKQDMRKEGVNSPNVADALMLTFAEEDNEYYNYEEELRRHAAQQGHSSSRRDSAAMP